MVSAESALPVLPISCASACRFSSNSCARYASALEGLGSRSSSVSDRSNVSEAYSLLSSSTAFPGVDPESDSELGNRDFAVAVGGDKCLTRGARRGDGDGEEGDARTSRSLSSSDEATTRLRAGRAVLDLRMANVSSSTTSEARGGGMEIGATTAVLLSRGGDDGGVEVGKSVKDDELKDTPRRLGGMADLVSGTEGRVRDGCPEALALGCLTAPAALRWYCFLRPCMNIFSSAGSCSSSSPFLPSSLVTSALPTSRPPSEFKNDKPLPSHRLNNALLGETAGADSSDWRERIVAVDSGAAIGTVKVIRGSSVGGVATRARRYVCLGAAASASE